MFVVIGHKFSLFSTLSDTGTEVRILLLVSHLRAYSPESASERGCCTVSSWLPFLVKAKQHTVRKTQKRRGARSTEHVTYTTETGSARLIHEHVGLPESCSREMWSSFPEHACISTGADRLRRSDGIKHSTWKTFPRQCPFHLEGSEKNNMSNCYNCDRRGFFFFNLLIAWAELARHCCSSRAGTQEENS